MTGAVISRLLRVLNHIGNCQRGRLSQLPDSSLAVSSLPLGHQFQDLVDRVVLLAGPELDPGDQQLVDGWQQTRVNCRLIPNALDDPRHTEKPSSGMRR